MGPRLPGQWRYHQRGRSARDERAAELLDELTEQLGPPDEGMVAEAVGD